MSLVMHFSWSGHVFLSLQVHGSMTSHCGLLLPVMRVLCLEIIDLTLFMHAAITDLDCVSVENLVQLVVRWEMLVYQA